VKPTLHTFLYFVLYLGQATWQCSRSPVCWMGEANVKQCTSKEIQELTNQVC